MTVIIKSGAFIPTLPVAIINLKTGERLLNPKFHAYCSVGDRGYEIGGGRVVYFNKNGMSDHSHYIIVNYEII